MSLSRNAAALALAAALLVPAAAQAVPVLISYSGTIRQANADTATLFGLAPGSVIGTPVSGRITYDTSAFRTPPSPTSGPGYDGWNSTDGSLAQGAIVVTQTINGITLTYDGIYYNDLLAATSTGLYAYGFYGQKLGIVSESNSPSGVNVAQFNFVSDDPASGLMNPARNPAGPFNLYAALQSDFFFQAGWNTPDLNASWVLTIPDASIPEPASGLLLLPAMLALLACGRGALASQAPDRES
jgi:hypothetical protein